MKKWFVFFYKIFFLSVFLMAAFGQFQRIELTEQVAGYMHEILLLGFLTFSAIQFFQEPQLIQKIKSKISLPIAALFCYIAVQTLVYQFLSPDAVPLLYLLRLSAYLTFPLAIWYGLQTKMLSKNEVYYTLLTFGGAITAFGLVQYAYLPDTRFLFYLGWDDHFYRLISTLFDPGFTGMIITITFLLYLSNNLRKLTEKPAPHWLVLTQLSLALLLTYSRASYLAIAVGLICLSLITKKIRPLFFLLPLLIGIFWLPRPGGEGVKLERVFSAQSRVNTTLQTIQKLSPVELVVGEGWYRERRYSENGLTNTAKTTDNSLVFIFSSMGGVGCALLLYGVWAYRKVLLHPTLFPILAAVLTHSMFNNTLFYNFCLLMLGGVVALSQTAGRGESK